MRAWPLLLVAGPGLITLTGLGLVFTRGTWGGPLPRDNPAAHLRPLKPHTDHSGFLSGPFADGPAVTRACLRWDPTPVTQPPRFLEQGLWL
jgi:hypothetical protein